ncbi:MAG: mycoredoxin [Actinobacteria bacterium]|nr:mycoredoxin [Actinomycetota bacterium]
MSADGIIMYSTTWCGYCTRLRTQLDRAGIGYTVVDIEHDEQAAKWVETANRGNRTVPTLRFSDDSALTNPSVIEVQARLAEIATIG